MSSVHAYVTFFFYEPRVFLIYILILPLLKAIQIIWIIHINEIVNGRQGIYYLNLRPQRQVTPAGFKEPKTMLKNTYSTLHHIP